MYSIASKLGRALPAPDHASVSERLTSFHRAILKAGQAIGLELNFHGDEIHPMQAGELGGELKALAISHLERVSQMFLWDSWVCPDFASLSQITPEGIAAMASRPTFATLLPTTAYILRLEPPPARFVVSDMRIDEQHCQP